MKIRGKKKQKSPKRLCSKGFGDLFHEMQYWRRFQGLCHLQKRKKALLILFHNQATTSIKLRKEINWLPHFSMLLWRSAGACTSM